MCLGVAFNGSMSPVETNVRLGQEAQPRIGEYGDNQQLAWRKRAGADMDQFKNCSSRAARVVAREKITMPSGSARGRVLSDKKSG